MKKFLKIVAFVTFLFAACMPLTTHAELRLGSEDNGYKTYFDTDSLAYDENNEILYVHAYGYDPDGNQLFDSVFSYYNEGDIFYFKVSSDSDWKNVADYPLQAQFLYAVLLYLQELQ